jgi:hypothetical protein
VDEKAEFLWISIDYSRKQIFPLEEGLNYIRGLGGSLVFLGEHNGAPAILRNEKRFEFGYMSGSEVREIIVGQELLLRDGGDQVI